MSGTIEQVLHIIGSAVDQLDQGISVIDSELRLVLTNRRLAEMLDLPAELIQPGKTLEDAFRYNARRGEYGTGDIDELVGQRMALARQFRAHCFQRTRPDRRVIEVRGNPLPGGGFVTTYTDVTERLRYEEALKKSHEELEKRVAERTEELAHKSAILETTLENMSQAISLFDRDLRLAACNRRYLELLEFPEELGKPGTPLAAFFRYNAERGEYGPGDVEEKVRERVELARHWVPHRFLRTRPDGTVLEVRGTPFASGFVTTYTDITELKRREQELEALNRNLEELVAQRTADLARKAAELEQACERLLELDRLKSEFLSSVSHELRTPLTSILGFAKLLAKEFETTFRPLVAGNDKLARRAERVARNLEVIVHEGERLTRLINDVLDLAKIESGRVDWHDAVTDVKDLVEHSVQAVSGQFAGLPKVALTVDVAPDLPQVNVDRDRITQVLVNLLNNAGKFTKAGAVAVSAALNARGEVQLSVRDTGSGIPAEFLDTVFDKFRQVTTDTLTDKPEGTGLGLPICLEIVRHYGGRIWAESEAGRGSTFLFTLPALQAQAQSEDGAGSPAPGSRTRPLILVVDDEPGISALLAQILEDDGYDVITAGDGKAALRLARSHRPELITMDIMMPGMDGYTAIEHLRNDDLLGRIPIVVISALGEDAKLKGAATLKKPVDEALLLQSVRSLLTRDGALRPRPALQQPVHRG